MKHLDFWLFETTGFRRRSLLKSAVTCQCLDLYESVDGVAAVKETPVTWSDGRQQLKRLLDLTLCAIITAARASDCSCSTFSESTTWERVCYCLVWNLSQCSETFLPTTFHVLIIEIAWWTSEGVSIFLPWGHKLARGCMHTLILQ